MALKISQLPRRYDTIVIGGGLSGLILSQLLTRIGQKVLLVDRQEEFGGLARTQPAPWGKTSLGLKLIPDTESAHSALDFLQTLLGEDIARESVELPAITYDAGFKPFIGFGEDAPNYADEIDYYTISKRLKLDTQPHNWVAKLTEELTCDFLQEAFVTQILTEEDPNSKKDYRLTGVTLNGHKEVLAENVIYCSSPRDLLDLLPEEKIQRKVSKALIRSKIWTSVSLDLYHKNTVSEEQSLHVLMTKKPPYEPLWGVFHPPVETEEFTGQHSQWMTLVEAELTRDSEMVGNALKAIKKQIKRAYPEALDEMHSERLRVNFASHGSTELALTGQQTLPGFENLWVAGATVNPQKNLIGTLQQVRLVAAAFGVSEEEIPTLTSETSEDVTLEPQSETELPL